jgi:acyl-CoA thioesterase-1
MNPAVLYFASGESLYAGAAVLLLAMAMSPYCKRGSLLQLRNCAAWLALALMVMASPPFAWVIDAIFFSTFVMWFIAANRAAPGQALVRLRLAATAVLLVLLLVFPTMEFFRRTMPAIVGAPDNHLVVIGDSISSGIDARVPPWPVLMERATGVPVKNLARPGAQAIEGSALAEQVAPEDRVVVIEIGGNDLLGGVPSEEFGRGLEALLEKVARPGRTVVMFELPLLPNRVAYGQVQRRLAARYGVWLIPKRCFTDVIAGADATSDGLHLSELGSHRMSALVARILSPVLESRNKRILP